MSQSRRTFLQQVSAAAALGLVSPLPGRRLWAVTPTELLPEPNEARLRELALVAVDAARRAGAMFADVRVTGGRCLSLGFTATYQQGGKPEMVQPLVDVRTAYGIRAIVDGAWGFAGGSELTPDGVRAVAERAVIRARGNRPRRPRTLELAPVPRAEQGEWATPIGQDPFLVPIGEQVDLAFAALTEAGRVKGLDHASLGVYWGSNVHVFASSEGALIVQRRVTGDPSLTVSVFPTDAAAGVAQPVPLRRGPYGYEALADVQAALREAAEQAVAESKRSQPPVVDSGVGRYDLVLGAEVVSQLLAATILPALNLERALGYHANRGGTSFAAPPAEILGKYTVGSPLLTLRADRTRPRGPATVGWDDEGVRAGETTLVQGGVVVDYLTTRQTAMELAGWYRSRGGAVRSQGFTAGAGDVVPTIGLPNITMTPGAENVSVEDLIADTKRGYYVKGGGGLADQQLLNTQGLANDDRDVREIRNGKLGARVRGFGFQFITPSFWKSMDAIGGSVSQVVTFHGTRYNGVVEPLQMRLAHADAVPARMRQVNVMALGMTR